MSATLQFCLLVIPILAITANPISSSFNRILGGYETSKYDFPYVASVRVNNIHTCTGTIIGENVILTAASCVTEIGNNSPIPSKYITVRVGSTNSFSGGEIVQVESFLVHSNYNGFKNNVATLILLNNLKWTDRIASIQIASNDIDIPPSETLVTVAGWGQQNNIAPYKLYAQQFTTTNSTTCREAYDDYDSTIFCLAHKLNEGNCYGDIGNGAIYKKKLIGISNFIIGKCGSRYPDVFTNILQYTNWIKFSFEITHNFNKSFSSYSVSLN